MAHLFKKLVDEVSELSEECSKALFTLQKLLGEEGGVSISNIATKPKRLGEDDTIVGGLADNKTVEEIAEKHSVPIEDIESQLEMGIEIEKEHTDNDEQAREIAMDHLMEIPDYYNRLDKMEREAMGNDDLDEADDSTTVEWIQNNRVQEKVFPNPRAAEAHKKTLNTKGISKVSIYPTQG